MKNRIISLILVLVISALALVSCGFSFADDDLSAYATFADKTAFENALKTLVIEDGNFTNDEETRAKKVLDAIYSDLASSVKNTGEHKTSGVPGAHDIIYYSYYCTADFDGETAVLFASYMKADNAAGMQLGLSDVTELGEKMSALLSGVDLTDKVYKTETTGEINEGDVVYVSYTYTHQVEVKDDKTGETATKEETVKVANERIALVKDSSDFVNFLLEKNKGIGKSVENYDGADGKDYTGIMINWRSTGEELGTVTDTTYTETKTVTDVNGKPRDLKDKELTYHVYPTYYISVPEINATSLINDVRGSNLSFDYVTELLFGKDFADKTDEEKKTVLDAYITKDGDKDVSLEELVKSIAELQKTLSSAKTALDKANSTLETEQQDYDTAEKNYNEDKTDAKKETLDKALENLNAAKTAQEKAKGEYDTALANRDAKVKAFLSINADMEKSVVDGYERVKYESLRATYNNEIKMNLAKEVYALLEKSIQVSSTPNDPVKASIDQIVENYEYEFYNGKYDTDKGISNYAQYKGSFKSYLVDAVSKDIKSVKTYDEAMVAINEKAIQYVEPIVRIYVAAKAFGVVASEDEYEAYKEDVNNSYSYNEYTYGANSVLYAYQFDKLMNYILEYEEADDGSFAYERVAYTFKAESDAE